MHDSKLHNKRRNEGFTLIELMIVVIIIGILASLAIPRFMQASTKSKQSEAKLTLKHIYTMERAYRQEFNAYCGDFNIIGATLPNNPRYAYSFASITPTSFVIQAAGNLDDDATVDTWTINQNGQLACTINDVEG